MKPLPLLIAFLLGASATAAVLPPLLGTAQPSQAPTVAALEQTARTWAAPMQPLVVTCKPDGACTVVTARAVVAAWCDVEGCEMHCEDGR